MMNFKTCIWLLAGVWLLLTACQPTTVNTTSQIELPAQYTFAGLADNGVEVDIAHWWRSWGDTCLNQLIEKALHNNIDIKVAQARVLEARSFADLARADLGPMVGVNAHFGGQAGEVDNNLGAEVNSLSTSVLGQDLSDSFSVNGIHYAYGIAASWEPDIFGKKQSDADAARYAALGVEEIAWGTRIVVAANVADHYVQARSIARQMQLMDDTIKTVTEMQHYVAGRFGAGQTTRFELADVETRLTALYAQRAPLQALHDLHVRQIAVLLGEPPQTFTLQESKSDVLAQLPPAPRGVVPSDLLLRRPDIRARALALYAFSARLASSRADLLPRFYISFLAEDGHIGLSDLPNVDGWMGLLDVGVHLPIFTSGRIQANIRASEARLDEAARQYDKSILKALSEVDSTCQMRSALNARSTFLDKTISKSEERTHAAKMLYTHGEKAFQDVLDAELATLQYRNRWVETRLNMAQATIRLYQALGGGWPVHDQPGQCQGK
ncbi:TolC family protein [Desulforhopalus vacuolatus]|uniref:efflux transporter outer membrane subunit n=1 Tax=Desulforhopalus vacuolatus TaxID=40414 RepID=UPI0019635E9B|nr:TolC family protein [Desulforhopalus vacuolatus]MBM9518952.1 TolC family protein [Desulforhopalus vacuolatus]